MDVLRNRALPPGSLVLAPHQDDEVVGAAVLISRSHDCNVVHLTDGAPRDPRFWPRSFQGNREAYVQVRRSEAQAALALVGVPAAHIHNLGATDQEAALQIAALARRLTSLLQRLRPPVLVLPPYEGSHPDHDSAAVVGRCAAQLLRRASEDAPVLVEMTSYHAHGDNLVIGEFMPSEEPVVTLEPTAAERDLKRRMLECHASQAETLAPFSPGPERFRHAPPADFAQPPHAGKTWSERMGWMDGRTFRSLTRTAFDDLGVRPPFE